MKCRRGMGAPRTAVRGGVASRLRIELLAQPIEIFLAHDPPPAPLLSGIFVCRRSEDSITVTSPSYFASGGKSFLSCSAGHSEMG